MVYVDNAFVQRHGRLWCHLLADSLEELHEFAASVGLSVYAFHRAARIPHYDVTHRQRLLMLKMGAKPVTVRQGVALTRHLASGCRGTKPRQQELFA